MIVNMFSQKPNFETDYKAMKECLKYIKQLASFNNLTIAMPYKIGCGIAKGNWEKVEQIIIEVFKDYNVTLYRLGE